MTGPAHSTMSRLTELGVLFGRLGTTAFGGPAAHIAMMREEVVTRRAWLTDRDFLDLVAATHLIPGPNSTELAIHIGHRRAGWPGLIVAGAAFILPAVAIVGTLAWAYVNYGSRPDVRAVFATVAPVIIAIIARALVGLTRSAVRSMRLALIGIGAVLALVMGVRELAVLGGAAAIGLAFSRATRGSTPAAAGAALLTAMLSGPRPLLAFSARAVDQTVVGGALATGGATLGGIFSVFLKTGAVLFGSGYVLLAFLRADLVDRLGWLTERQLVDAIAIGQFTPGPVFTTATFVGYLLAGMSGAAAATIGIFLPAFAFVAISAPLIPRLRQSATMGSVLDAVTVASLALMAMVTWQLGVVSLTNLTTVLIALVSLVALSYTRVNSAWLILAAAFVGVLLR